MMQLKKTTLLTLILFFTLQNIYAQRNYWQQAIKYKMDVNFDVVKHQFNGKQEITYTNNSPETLDKVFYHLYFNAFQPGSMMDVRSQSLPDADPRVGSRISKLSPEEQGYLHATTVMQGSQELQFEEEGTILVVHLSDPILPGETTVFKMKFVGQVPTQIRRSGRDNKEGISYSMAQWYPKLCEFDDSGWHSNPYVGREFYGVWGDFDVTININKKYLVAATGELQNANSIGMGYSEKNRKKPKSKKGKVKWNFVAKNVHDFVWAADPDYEHMTYQGENGPKMHFFYQKGEATEAWEQLPEIMAEAFSFMNKKYGEYPYPVYSFIQGGDGGMEYPMATLITGHRNLGSLVGVSVHELFHSWYQMVLGSNESLYAWMDEGFTSYASAETMNHLRRKGYLGGEPKDGEIHERTILGFANFTKSGKEEALTTHSDHFALNTSYSVAAYVKGSVFLTQIRYIIGEENFDQVMLDYYNTWKFKHPVPNDFIRIAEKQADLELDWFREYFVNSTHTIDYGIDSVYEQNNTAKLTLERIGRFPMPIDLQITYMDGERENYTIPLRIMRGEKKAEHGTNYTLLEDWNWVNKKYTINLNRALSDIETIQIDASKRLVDVERANNLWTKK